MSVSGVPGCGWTGAGGVRWRKAAAHGNGVTYQRIRKFDNMSTAASPALESQPTRVFTLAMYRSSSTEGLFDGG
eukprot:scaffold16864_cov53-Phaeocystis_antarctica.AAC.2